MSEAEIERRMAELDRLLNDPETRMDAHRVWALLAELARQPQPARR
ncbi:peptide chain release factor 1 [Roseomonas rosulenta]|nr:peptide chain release factor 1 [Roseomonas rosulenta]